MTVLNLSVKFEVFSIKIKLSGRQVSLEKLIREATVAKFLSQFGMDVLDFGLALLSMHSPFEVSSKADI
jgi:hypothetical protein